MKKIISSLDKIKRQAQPRLRSIPPSKRSTQTELYLIQKEKEHFDREKNRLQQRMEYIDTRLSQIEQELQLLLLEWEAEMTNLKQSYQPRPRDKGSWSTKVLKY